ncbi:MAG: alginate O-acetylation protein [Nitrospirales bacterium]|nr:MAG: alginate O-acetylation protein [Nitrospirales bacterium]
MLLKSHVFCPWDYGNINDTNSVKIYYNRLGKYPSTHPQHFMLFNSYIFIFLFLPITVITFYLLGGHGQNRLALAWLVAASLFFYGWWNPAYLFIIIGSIIMNYSIGKTLSRQQGHNPSMLLLGTGITLNLTLIGYFKYANFFLENMNVTLGSHYSLDHIILPLGISFFTFQQIAYLVDAYRGETTNNSFLQYCLFVTFFPQLIAGPIVHHKEILPQFAQRAIFTFNPENLSVGLTIFTLGLFKKVILADTLAGYASPVFSAAEQGVTLTFFEAWGGSLAYTFQLYFDFSGYSDMAIGLGRMLGIRLPLNFNSPYKSVNIIDFWRRWHITLSRFLRDYLYFPLGGNRQGTLCQYRNLFITMLLGGLWHGAGWTFIFWGALHGLFLASNHAWHQVYHRYAFARVIKPSRIGKICAQTFTFLMIVIAWVVFRAESLETAVSLWQSMAGIHGISLPQLLGHAIDGYEIWVPAQWIVFDGMFPHNTAPWAFRGTLTLLIAGGIVWLTPNVAQILHHYNPVIHHDPPSTRIAWHGSPTWAAGIGLLFGLSVLGLGTATEFLYFQF